MSFDFSWFTTVPGLLITGGVVLLIVALVILIVSSKKSKKEKKALEATNTANANAQNTPAIPTDINVAASVPGAAVDAQAVNAGAVVDAQAVGVQPGAGQVMPGMDMASPTPVQQVAQPAPAMDPMMAVQPSVAQAMPGMDAASANPFQVPSATPDMTAATQVTPGAIYGGANPAAVQTTGAQTVSQPQIYGGVDPMASIAPVAPIGGAQQTIAMPDVAAVAPIGMMPQ